MNKINKKEGRKFEQVSKIKEATSYVTKNIDFLQDVKSKFFFIIYINDFQYFYLRCQEFVITFLDTLLYHSQHFYQVKYLLINESY